MQIVARETRRVELDHLHGGPATPTEQFSNRRGIALIGGDVLLQFTNDVPQTVNLLLPLEVAFGPAGILDVALPAHRLPDRLRLPAVCRPQLHGENHRVAARMVVEHRLERRVGVDAAIPPALPFQPHRRKTRRKRCDAIT